MLQEILYGRLVRVIIRTIWIAFLCSSLIYGSVAPNPFLRPGSNRKPPPSVQPVFKPKKIIRPNFAQEVEFKGYFILKGQVYFSVFNKKVNHGEWITINEKTYEDFLAQEFDLESETLTISYEGQSFELKLIQSEKSSVSPPIKKNLPSLNNPSRFTKTPTVPRYMPPKPKNTPTIPSWLVTDNRSNSKGITPISSRNSSFNSNKPLARTLPSLPYPGFVPRRTPVPNSSPSTSLLSPSIPSKKGGASEQISSTPPAQNDSMQSNPGASSPEQENSNANNKIDLGNLPPPPPPPNILPPSPPPNILPSRE